jgi:hypothetical protein
MNEFRNKDKNREYDVVDLDWLSVQCRRVLVSWHQCTGIAQGVIQSPGHSIDKRRSDP